MIILTSTTQHVTSAGGDIRCYSMGTLKLARVRLGGGHRVTSLLFPVLCCFLRTETFPPRGRLLDSENKLT